MRTKSILAISLIVVLVVGAISFDDVFADKEKEREKHDKDKNKVRDELDDKIQKAKVSKELRVIVSTDNDLEDLIKELGGKILYKYSIIDAIAVEMPAKKIHKLAQSQSVTFVDSDALVESLAQTTPWGVSRIDAPSTWSQSTGSGVQTAILDTGIDPKHNDLKSNIAFGVAFDKGNIKFNEKDWKDKNGHGTHVAGTVAAVDNSFGVVGVAPSSSLYAVRVLNSQGSGYLSDVIAGIEWSVKGPDGVIGNSDDADIISMSLGTTANISAFHDAVDAAYNNGVVIVAAAGNSGDGNPSTPELHYPAAYDSVIAVGATDINDNAPSWTNSGDHVEIVAPGVSVLSTYRGNSYAYLSGTSMATPHVSGTVALLLSLDSTLTPTEIRNILQTTAIDLGPTGLDTVYGHGLVNALDAISSISTPTLPPPSNNPPTANSQNVSTNQDTPVSIILSGNDIDGDSLTCQIATNPSNGVLSGDNCNWTYEPNPPFVGQDSFTFTVTDSNDSVSSQATVSIDVTLIPETTGNVLISSHSETIKDRGGNKIFKSDVRANVDGTPNDLKYTYTFDDGLSLDTIKKAELKINKAKSDIRSLAVTSGNSIQFDLSNFSLNNGDSIQVKLEIIYQNVVSGTQYSFTVAFEPGDSDTTSVTAKIKSDDK